MDDKEYRAFKARIAYQQFRDSLPKCHYCQHCESFKGRHGKVFACMKMKNMIDGRTKDSPKWCPYRGGINGG